jgi:hypothetical protein
VDDKETREALAELRFVVLFVFNQSIGGFVDQPRHFWNGLRAVIIHALVKPYGLLDRAPNPLDIDPFGGAVFQNGPRHQFIPLAVLNNLDGANREPDEGLLFQRQRIGEGRTGAQTAGRGRGEKLSHRWIPSVNGGRNR